MRAILVTIATLLATPANASSTIGDWFWRVLRSGTGTVQAHITSLNKGVEGLNIDCDPAGKLRVSLATDRKFSKLITESNETFRIEDRILQNPGGLLKILLAEETGARQAGARSFTFSFFLDDQKGAGYSANMGGLSRARDFVVKSCAGRSASGFDVTLAAEPWLTPDRRHSALFHHRGHYQLINLQTRQPVYTGNYKTDSTSLILDDGTDDRMQCRRSIDQVGNMILAGCPYAGRWTPLRNVR